jgi:hypothetical protein
VHLLVERLQSFRRRKKLGDVIGHRLKPRNRLKTIPGKLKLLLYTLSYMTPLQLSMWHLTIHLPISSRSHLKATTTTIATP